MSRFAVFIMAVFLYVGVDALFSNVITGTTAGELLTSTIVPIVFAVVVLGVLIRFFK